MGQNLFDYPMQKGSELNSASLVTVGDEIGNKFVKKS
jgi:hypothetical protein